MLLKFFINKGVFFTKITFLFLIPLSFKKLIILRFKSLTLFLFDCYCLEIFIVNLSNSFLFLFVIAKNGIRILL